MMTHGIGRILATGVFILLMMGMNTNAQAQQTPMPITYEQTIQGSLDAADLRLDTGSHYDVYIFQAEAGKSYVITAKSNAFAAMVDLIFGEGLLQAAFVVRPWAQVQFSGTLGQPGQYTILVKSYEVGALGPYTLTLSEGQLPGPQPPAVPPPASNNVGSLATFTCDTVSCPGSDDQSNIVSPGFGEVVSCTWHCATFENVPNRYVSIDFFRSPGSCWELSSTYVSDGIC